MGLISPVSTIANDVRRTAMVAESSRTSPRQWHSASKVWPSGIESMVAPFLISAGEASLLGVSGPPPPSEPSHWGNHKPPKYPSFFKSITQAQDRPARAPQPT